MSGAVNSPFTLVHWGRLQPTNLGPQQETGSRQVEKPPTLTLRPSLLTRRSYSKKSSTTFCLSDSHSVQLSLVFLRRHRPPAPPSEGPQVYYFVLVTTVPLPRQLSYYVRRCSSPWWDCLNPTSPPGLSHLLCLSWGRRTSLSLSSTTSKTVERKGSNI